MPTTTRKQHSTVHEFALTEALVLARRWGLTPSDQVLVFGRHVGGRVDSQTPDMTIGSHVDEGSSASAVISIEGGPYEWTLDDEVIEMLAATAEVRGVPVFLEPINHFQLGLYFEG